MPQNWIKHDVREYKTGNISIVETVKTPMTDDNPSGAATTTVVASVKEGTYNSLNQVKNGVQGIIEWIDMVTT